MTMLITSLVVFGVLMLLAHFVQKFSVGFAMAIIYIGEAAFLVWALPQVFGGHHG